MRLDDRGECDDSGVRVPPPLYFAVAFALGLLLDRVAPVRPSSRGRLRAVGLPLVLAGLGLMGSAIAVMRRAGTSPEPWEPTTAIVSDGPFRITRNPIYVGDMLVHAGASLMTNRLWPLLLLPAASIALTQQVVRREEEYLERKFGEEYRAYRRRVPRWL